MEQFGKTQKQKSPILIPAILFSFFLLLFPIDSALGEWLGTYSINNYIAIVTVAAIVVFASNRVRFQRDSFVSAYMIYVVYQIICMSYGGNMFSNRNVIFMFYNLMALLVMHVQWTKQELLLFKIAVVCSIVMACGIVFSHINFSSSGRLYLSLSRNIDQNYLCSNLIFGTAMLTNSFLMESKRLYKAFFAAILLWEFLCILYLGSRGGLLGNLAVVFIIFVTNFRQLSRSVISVFAVAMVLLLVVSTMGFALPQWMLDRFNLINMLNSDGSGRTEIWRTYTELYFDGNLLELLFGFGRGSIYNFVAYCKVLVCTHSIYIKALFESGLVGLTAMLVMFTSGLRKAVKNKAHAITAIIVGYCVCGMFLDLDDYRIFPLMIMMIMLYYKTDFYVSRGDKLWSPL